MKYSGRTNNLSGEPYTLDQHSSVTFLKILSKLSNWAFAKLQMSPQNEMRESCQNAVFRSIIESKISWQKPEKLKMPCFSVFDNFQRIFLKRQMTKIVVLTSHERRILWHQTQFCKNPVIPIASQILSVVRSFIFSGTIDIAIPKPFCLRRVVVCQHQLFQEEKQ